MNIENIQAKIAVRRHPRVILPLTPLLTTVFICAALAAAQNPWTPMDAGKAPNFNVGTALLLTDGRILVQEARTSNWHTLSPDKFGVYHSGTWKKVGSFPASMNYVPTYFASAVLPDGRVIVEGGEYNNGVNVDTNLGAIFDPRTDSWKQVQPPAGWLHIGDAPSVVLPNGQFMMGHIVDTSAAILDPTTLKYCNPWRREGRSERRRRLDAVARQHSAYRRHLRQNCFQFEQPKIGDLRSRLAFLE